MTRIRTLIATLVGVPLLALALTTAPASATTPPGSIQIYNQVQLVSSLPGRLTVTITYNCSPAADGTTTGLIQAVVEQNGNGANGTSVATCDDRSHTTAVDTTGIGPFAPGAAGAAAGVQNIDATSFAFDSRGVMIR